MENAAEALKMGAAILIFIIALTTAFSMFGLAKQTADSIIAMRDKQAYLESEEVENILYTQSSSIQTGAQAGSILSVVGGFTTRGDRVVDISDVVSTIYRYSKEKYGVTIVTQTGNVIARFDSTREMSYMSNWNSRTTAQKNAIAKLIKDNLVNNYVSINLDRGTLEDLYELRDANNNKRYGENWRGNDETIKEKINVDLNGGTFQNLGLKYEGKKILDKITGKKIVEVTNEIDRNEYLQGDDGADTELLQQYNMPTVEIIYIVYNN